MPPAAPPLPPRLADPRPVVGAGTVAWFATAAVLLVTGGTPVWIGSCLAGGMLGLLGFVMIHAQHNAARRGTRGAQQGLL